MSGQVSEEIWASDPEVPAPRLRYPISIRTQVRVLNFDIDVAELKSEHKKFLNVKVIPASARLGLDVAPRSAANSQAELLREPHSVHLLLGGRCLSKKTD